MSRPAGDERQQLQWFLPAAAFAHFCGVSALAGPVNPRTAARRRASERRDRRRIAVVKYRFCDIQPMIRQTLLSGVLTGDRQ
jgi:hypothetical protein